MCLHDYIDHLKFQFKLKKKKHHESQNQEFIPTSLHSSNRILLMADELMKSTIRHVIIY